MCKELRVAGFICVMLPSILNDWNLDTVAVFQRFGLSSVLEGLNLAQPPIHPHTHSNTRIPKKKKSNVNVLSSPALLDISKNTGSTDVMLLTGRSRITRRKTFSGSNMFTTNFTRTGPVLPIAKHI